MDNVIRHFEISDYKGRGYDLVGDFENQVSIIIDPMCVGVFDFIHNAKIEFWRTVKIIDGDFHNGYCTEEYAKERIKYFKEKFFQFPWQDISVAEWYGKYKIARTDGICYEELEGVVYILDALEDMKRGECAIIPEPELHLHIEYQETLIEEIYRIAKEKEIQVIVYTQSPHIVSGHYDDIVELYREHKE